MIQEQPSHKLTLIQRSALTMTGVTEVVSFDDNSVILQTNMGTLTVQGQQLQLKNLSLDGGQIEISGSVSALIYEEPRQAGSWFQRILR